jgi:hypothetical protein
MVQFLVSLVVMVLGMTLYVYAGEISDWLELHVAKKAKS